MDEEREREGHKLPRSEEEHKDAQTEQDAEGHLIKGHRQDEEEDEGSERGDAGRFRGA
jgi:hypothetical protein